MKKTNSTKRRSGRSTRGAEPAVAKLGAETLITVAVVCFAAGYVLSAFLGGFSLWTDRSEVRQSPIQGVSIRPDWISDLEERVAADPENFEAWTELGNAFFDSDQYQKAIDAYQKSLAISPDNPNVITDMGIMYRRSGSPGRATEAFDRAIEVDPFHQFALYNKGLVLLHDLNDQTGAIEAWEALVSVSPGFRTPEGRVVADMLRALKN